MESACAVPSGSVLMPPSRKSRRVLMRCTTCALQGFSEPAIAVRTESERINAEVETDDDPILDVDTPWADRQPWSQRTVHHTPARFSSGVVQGIRHGAARLFKVGHTCRRSCNVALTARLPSA